MDAAIPGILAMMAGSGGGGGPSLSFAKTDTITDVSFSSGNVNYNGVDIGTPAADRLVIVALGEYNDTGAEVSGVQVNGVSAVKRAEADSSGAEISMIWVAEVPTGTSVTVRVTHPDNGTDFVGSVYAATGYEVVPFDTASSGGAVMSLDIAENGAAVASHYSRTNAGSGNTIWSGLADRDTNYLKAGAYSASQASESGLSSQTNRSIDANFSGGVMRECQCAISLEPA
jgi:hypothetical protein